MLPNAIHGDATGARAGAGEKEDAAQPPQQLLATFCTGLTLEVDHSLLQEWNHFETARQLLLQSDWF